MILTVPAAMTSRRRPRPRKPIPRLDDTGLIGRYKLESQWEPGESGGFISRAMQDQLGLRLESKTGPAPVYVIERIQRPSESR